MELLLFLALHGLVLVRKVLAPGQFEAGPTKASIDGQCSAGLKPRSCSALHLA